MSSRRRAVIDVGTNSVKLLIADVVADQIDPVLEESLQTRLGQGFYKDHRLKPQPIAQTATAVAKFAQTARQHGSAKVRVIATSAARDALNASELVSAIETASGLRVEIISGEREAEWVFQGVTTDPDLADKPVLLLDVGGGSTECILGHGRQKHFSESFPLGTVRLMEKIPHSDPPTIGEFNATRAWLQEFLSTTVRPRLETAICKEAGSADRTQTVQLVGTGGTTSILARMEAGLQDFDRTRIESTRLSFDRVRWHVLRLWGLPLREREKIIGLPPKRADVILTGALICQELMAQFQFAELRVSTRGLRFAAAMNEN